MYHYFDYRGRKYACEITDYDGEKCWTAYRVDEWGVPRKIPCFTRAEEKKFPKAIGFKCQEILKSNTSIELA